MDAYAKKLSVQLQISDLQETRVNKLKELFNMHKGDHLLNFIIYDTEEQIKLNMPSRKQKIKISQELLDELESDGVFYKLN